MPDRVIRDELLRSHRYRTLSSDTSRLLFIHLLLCVDSLGNLEATATAIGDALHRSINEATAAALLGELADVDLVRLYQIDGKRYLHIPRFRQRLRYIRGRHPRPPAEIECKEIKELLEKVRPQSDCSQTVVARSEVKRSRSEVKKSAFSEPAANPAAPQQKIALENIATAKPKPGQQWDNQAWVNATALTLQIGRRIGEDFAAFKDRVYATLQARVQESATK